ncbi:hypothetical protein BDV19DRAFT_382014 [Aspergillus venezuelensis]
MKKTLLLVFIHGFKGGDDTFGNFPQHLQTLLSRKLPNICVTTLVYPKYETRGDLKETVHAFREWLQNQVIDLEVENETASPTVDPSVHVFLVGHSMGGIVAADTLLLLASEQPIPARTSPQSSHHKFDEDAEDTAGASSTNFSESGSFMFPHVQGVFAFDTPYLGIAPGVVSYGAEGHYKNITSTYNAFSEVAGLFGYGGNNASQKNASAPATDVKGSLPPASDSDAAATPSWQRWGRYAMFAGAAGAVAAGGAAAMYSQRQRLTDSWGWVSSHLTFVGCLARKTDLQQRVSQLSQVRKDRGIKSVNFYTCLGKSASSLVESNANETSNSQPQYFSSKIIRSKDRTFCTLPENPKEASPDKPNRQSGPGLEWVKAVNDRATDEIKAHTCMFIPKQNPAFSDLIDISCMAMVRSIDRGWYSTARGQSVYGSHDADVDTNMPRPEQNRAPHRAESGTVDNDGDEDVVVI